MMQSVTNLYLSIMLIEQPLCFIICIAGTARNTFYEAWIITRHFQWIIVYIQSRASTSSLNVDSLFHTSNLW